MVNVELRQWSPTEPSMAITDPTMQVASPLHHHFLSTFAILLNPSPCLNITSVAITSIILTYTLQLYLIFQLTTPSLLLSDSISSPYLSCAKLTVFSSV